MQKIRISDLGKFVGQEVTLQGWLFNKRSSGKIKFIILRDGSGYLQCVYFKGNLTEEVFDQADKIGQESSIEVTGKVKAEPRAPGGFELCLLYTSDAADERSSVDLGGRRIIKKKKNDKHEVRDRIQQKNYAED